MDSPGPSTELYPLQLSPSYNNTVTLNKPECNDIEVW